MRTPWYFQKKNFNFFDPEIVKKRASKVAHNRPRPFYFTVQPRPTAHSPELIFHIMKSRDQTSVLLSVNYSKLIYCCISSLMIPHRDETWSGYVLTICEISTILKLLKCSWFLAYFEYEAFPVMIPCFFSIHRMKNFLCFFSFFMVIIGLFWIKWKITVMFQLN